MSSSEQLRICIAPFAREIRRRGYITSPLLEDPLRKSPINHDEAVYIWEHVLKKERFEIFAELTDAAFTRAEHKREKRPPYGLVTFIEKRNSIIEEVKPEYERVTTLPKEHPYEALSSFMRDTLHESFREE